ncbi:MAG: hypothetical protein BI182_05845 [Acetobacterium sp. MES1]|uniref:leucine-rich repeat domain-containing protein n=1 Tax=Acetobacterium sp. MES1 TaxID=1899015 RepID=UPI000B9CEF46|nr:leucine-rich repeat protein [Acetobacterium sp. MES1]OXS25252.1 MAG: hypothetical protein BI182_05845 [Acetobacterium sp. MES1]
MMKSLFEKRILKKSLLVIIAFVMCNGVLGAGVLAQENEAVKDKLPSLDTIQTNGDKMPQLSPAEAVISTASETEGDYEYYSYDDGVTINKYTGSDEKVTIPAMINGVPVRYISYRSFNTCDSVTEIIVPEGVNYIGNEAFYNCTNLTKVTLPNSLENMHVSPFSGCFKLAEIVVDPKNAYFKVVNGMLLSRSGETIYACPAAKSSVDIPEGVTVISESAFSDCEKLQTIALPASLLTIEKNAFEFCKGISSISIPDKTQTIGVGAFVYCDKLENISFGKNLTRLDMVAFADCDSLKEVTLPESLSSLTGYDVFARCPQLTKVVIPETITKISGDMFDGSALANIYGKKGSYAETYAATYSIPFIPLEILSLSSFTTDLPSGQLVNTNITLSAFGAEGKTPYQYQFSYQLGDKTGIIQAFGAANTATFTPAVAGSYTLIAEVKDSDGKTATSSLTMRISDGSTAEPEFLSYIGKSASGKYFRYSQADFNNAYLAYQINPALASAKMYQQFLDSGCQIIALEDAAKGYLDYRAAANACLLAQMKGEAFNILTYFASDEASLLAETVSNVKNVDQYGNIS